MAVSSTVRIPSAHVQRQAGLTVASARERESVLVLAARASVLQAMGIQGSHASSVPKVLFSMRRLSLAFLSTYLIPPHHCHQPLSHQVQLPHRTLQSLKTRAKPGVALR